MGDVRPDNGSPPDDGGGSQSRGLPDLPPEWGTIVIPDDPAELAAEAEALRREMRGSARRTKIRKVLGLSGDQPSSLGIPVVIMTVAILTTLVSLLVVTWGNQPTGTYPPTTGDQKTSTSNSNTPTPDLHTPLTDLKFSDARGNQARLGDFAPMIVLLINGCNCQQLVTSVATAVPAGVHVIPVDRTATSAANDPTNVIRLADPVGTLRARFGNPTPNGKATAIVISSAGKTVASLTNVSSVADVKPLNPS